MLAMYLLSPLEEFSWETILKKIIIMLAGLLEIFSKCFLSILQKYAVVVSGCSL